jgi:hypothetical protein
MTLTATIKQGTFTRATLLGSAPSGKTFFWRDPRHMGLILV